jgi:hypothetical protein
MNIKTLDYAIETVMAQDGRTQFRLFLPARPERGLIEHPSITAVGQAGKCGYGFYMLIRGQDSVLESIGNQNEPLPIEVFEQATSDQGLTIVYLDKEGQIVNGQILWLEQGDLEALSPHAARPKP